MTSSRLLEEEDVSRGIPPDHPLDDEILTDPDAAVAFVLDRLRRRGR